MADRREWIRCLGLDHTVRIFWCIPLTDGGEAFRDGPAPETVSLFSPAASCHEFSGSISSFVERCS